jgi:hypothetical protein
VLARFNLPASKKAEGKSMLRNGWSISLNGKILVPRKKTVSEIMRDIALSTLDFCDSLELLDIELETVGR